MVEPLRHRQTKGAATDMFYLTPPRHISTLPRLCENSDVGLARRTFVSIRWNKKRTAVSGSGVSDANRRHFRTQSCIAINVFRSSAISAIQTINEGTSCPAGRGVNIRIGRGEMPPL